MTSGTDPIFDALRQEMVDKQIAPRGIRDARVLDAMRAIPRHLFLPPDCWEEAYADHPVRIGCGQTISQPFMVAVMTELLALSDNDRVLEIGTGSGYQTAILARLAREVISIERHDALAVQARQHLAAMGCHNVAIHTGDGSTGWPAGAPYDAILVTAASPTLPPSLKAQLADGGRLVCPAGGRDLQRLLKVTRHGMNYCESESIACIFVPLVGNEGWPESVS
jgi:protein-L-isoaspartate(D-aspartate) O-methyltransferase